MAVKSPDLCSRHQAHAILRVKRTGRKVFYSLAVRHRVDTCSSGERRLPGQRNCSSSSSRARWQPGRYSSSCRGHAVTHGHVSCRSRSVKCDEGRKEGKAAREKKKMSAGARFANFGPLIGRLNPKRTGAPGPMPAKQPATSTSPLAHLPSIPASPPSLSALRPTQRHAPHIHNGTRIHPHQHSPATLPRFRSKKERPNNR